MPFAATDAGPVAQVKRPGTVEPSPEWYGYQTFDLGTVTLAAGSGSSTITTVPGTTNASGQATFTVKDTVAQSVTYTATDTSDSVTVTQTASVAFTAGTPTAAQSTVSASPSSVAAAGRSTAQRQSRPQTREGRGFIE